ncbi:NIPSNAP family protein [Streptomyces sp. NPDC006992]|uniref:NIPSNAP family protein n=1 Tax=Streptomyces sp. NPDC006992 TaxID=3155601 RepID=UPI0033D2AE7E
MVDSDDVLLLRPVPGARAAADSPAVRPPVGAPAPDRFVSATVWSFPSGQRDGIASIRDGLLPALMETGPAPLAFLVTEEARNTFPGLPVRTGENVAVLLFSYPDENAHRRHLDEAAARIPVRDDVLPDLARLQTAAPRRLRLAPTGRSLLV